MVHGSEVPAPQVQVQGSEVPASQVQVWVYGSKVASSVIILVSLYSRVRRVCGSKVAGFHDSKVSAF